MDLASLSIKRPIFITCIVLLMVVLGALSLFKLPVDLFPDVNFPIVVVSIRYPGAGPSEMETQVSKVVEEEIGSLPGIKNVTSTSKEGVCTIVSEFSLETDIKYAEQQIRDRVSALKYKLPKEAKEPVIRRLDPADQPIMIISVTANLPDAKLYELANETIKPKFEQLNNVGQVTISGGRKREILVALNRSDLKTYELTAGQVAQAIGNSGLNIPAGQLDRGAKQTVYRMVGEYTQISDIAQPNVSFVGNDRPIQVGNVATIQDQLEEETSRAYFNGNKTLVLNVYKQSGSNTIAVAKSIRKQIQKIQDGFPSTSEKPRIEIVRDGSNDININVKDVKETILLGILLTIIVVYLFLGNVRSTIITCLALPNSLLGAFLLMSVAGFSINVMSLLALSLTVGLLVDDAIVVRENIFRHIEMGKSRIQAALDGTKEVRLAVIATTLTVVAVFGPIAFLQGIVGQFFKQFGLTICFAMLISLFDALTIAPMLSAYFADVDQGKPGVISRFWTATVGQVAVRFGKFQDKLEVLYERVLGVSVRYPFLIIMTALVIFLGSFFAIANVPKTFLPASDYGEFMVSLEMPEGTTLDRMHQVAGEVDVKIRNHKELKSSLLITGTDQGTNRADIFVRLVSSKMRNVNTSEMKDILRKELAVYKFANPVVKDVDIVGGGQRPFNLTIVGNDLDQIKLVAEKVFKKLEKNPGLQDPEISYKIGKPEYQMIIDNKKADSLGVLSSQIGAELRAQVEGVVPAVFRENGLEYDIRVRVQDSQRDLASHFGDVFVPNVNNRLIRLSDFATPVSRIGPASITRFNRGRYIQISADIAPDGPGIGGVMAEIRQMLDHDDPLPKGMRYVFQGQAENFEELGANMAIAALLGVLFIYLVLASLYESFITPVTIMVVLPLAVCGAFYSLLFANKSLDLFSMIGCVMLLGVATKNSILLVDYAQQLIAEGYDQTTAIIKAGRTRLRPILMTTFALIAGMIPVAIGLNEASSQRTSMGVAIIGGLISSTLLSLIVVPAVFGYVERFRRWVHQ